MKVEVKISADITQPYAVIYANELTEEIKLAAAILEKEKKAIAVNDNDRIVVLQPAEVYMIRMENSAVAVYCQSKKYTSKKRLHEIAAQLGNEFMRISKSVYVNLKQIDCVEPFFNGMMNLKLKNGCSEYISRKYLPEFKKYLGL